jgi:hypothetical protein
MSRKSTDRRPASSSFAPLAKATGAGKRLARLREALIPSRRLHVVVVCQTPHIEGAGTVPVGRWHNAMFLGSWSDAEREAWLAEAARDPRYQAPPPGWTPPASSETAMPGLRVVLTNSERALASDGSPARALPAATTRFLPDDDDVPPIGLPFTLGGPR